MQAILIAVALLIVGYIVGSVKIVNQGNEALVERLGRFHRKLGPGLNFIVPLLDKIVFEVSVREQVFDIEPKDAITRDNVSLKVDAVVYWRILQLERTYYNVDDLEEALTNLVVTTLRSTIGRMNLEETFSSRADINHTLLLELDDATGVWGVKVTRVEVQSITPTQTMLDALEQERAAQSRKKAAILEAEGKKQAQIEEAEGTVQSMKMISDALRQQTNSQQILKYMIAQRYIDSNYRLGSSNNSKIVFMDPKGLTEAMAELIVEENNPPRSEQGNGSAS